eukprot:gene17031-41130_t
MRGRAASALLRRVGALLPTPPTTRSPPSTATDAADAHNK